MAIKMIKILSIGNSFSQDAQRWLYQLAHAAGDEIYTRNLYIGGCPLVRHWNNFEGNVAGAYASEANGVNDNGKSSSLLDGLKSEDWDFITLQQVSNNAGRPETYEPYLGNLISAIKELCPKARICFQQTWEYEYCSVHGEFIYYEKSCDLMYGSIRAAVRGYTDKYGLLVLPTGDAVHAAKKLPEFDSEHGGQSLYRDGFHLHLLYGRYLAACVWYAKLLGKSPVGIDYAPEDADKTLCELLQKVAEEVCFPKEG